MADTYNTHTTIENKAPTVFEKIALVLLAVGAANWALIALFDFNIVSSLFGIDTFLTNAVYILVAVSAFAILRPLFQRAY